MSNNITLADIKAAAAKKYASFGFDVDGHPVELRNGLRLSKAERTRVGELQEEMSSEAEDSRDQEDILLDLLGVLCATEGQFNKLKKGIGDDLAVLVEVFEQYKEATQMGEASPSQD